MDKEGGDESASKGRAGWRKSFVGGGGSIHVVATFCLAFIRLSESEQRERERDEKRAKKEIDKESNERESYFRRRRPALRPLSFSLRSRGGGTVPSFLGESRIIRGH